MIGARGPTGCGGPAPRSRPDACVVLVRYRRRGSDVCIARSLHTRRPGSLTPGPGRLDLALGDHGGRDPAQHQRQEGRQGHQHQHRDDHPDPARDRQQAQQQATVDDHQPRGRPPVEPRLPGPHDRLATAEHRGHQVGQRTGEQLRGEADDQHRAHPAVADGDLAPRRGRGQPHQHEADARQPPQDRQPDRRRRELARQPRPDRREHRAGPPQESDRIPDQRGDRQPAQVGQRPGDQQRQRQHQPRQRLGGAGLGARPDLGAQHRRPQGQQGAGDGEPDPAEHIDHRVRQQDPPVRRVVQADRQRRAEGGADRQGDGGGQVVADGDPEAARQRAAQAPPQLDAVPEHRGRDHGGADDGQPPGRGRDADQRQRGADEEQDQPPRLDAPVVQPGTGLEQRLGEVGAPHHDRVGQRAEQHQVDHQPAGLGDVLVGDRDDHSQDHPQHPGPVAQGPVAARAAPARGRAASRGSGGGRGGAGGVRHPSSSGSWWRRVWGGRRRCRRRGCGGGHLGRGTGQGWGGWQTGHARRGWRPRRW